MRPRPAPRPRRRAAALLAAGSVVSVCGAFAASGLVTACGPETAANPSYLLVELVPAESASAEPAAARVVVSGAAGDIATFCVRLGGDTPASFVLERGAGKPASDRITVEVLAFAALSGQENAALGKEFACPATLPPALTGAQVIETDFCEAQTRRLVFHVGAVCACAEEDAGTGDAGTGDAGDAGAGDAGVSDAGDAGVPDAGEVPCGCAGGFTCGAGLTSAGQSCGPAMCCVTTLSAACALET